MCFEASVNFLEGLSKMSALRGEKSGGHAQGKKSQHIISDRLRLTCVCVFNSLETRKFKS